MYVTKKHSMQHSGAVSGMAAQQTCGTDYIIDVVDLRNKK